MIEWLTVTEVAAMLDLQPKTIYLLAAESCSEERRLTSHRLGPKGGKLRFKKSDVEAYIESTRTVVKASHRPLKHLEPKRSAAREVSHHVEAPNGVNR